MQRDRFRNRCGRLAFVSLALAAPLRAADWPSWRGPQGNLVTPERNLPVRWSPTENVRWRVDLPERGNSSPVVWGDRVFLTQPLQKAQRRTLLCLDRETGKTLWQRGIDWPHDEQTHKTNPFCSASPVTDGERVIVWFGSAGLVCYDFAGREQWRRDLGRQEHMWGYGTSPILYGDLCILAFGPGKREILFALDKRTGKSVWELDQYDVEADVLPEKDDEPVEVGPPGLDADGRARVARLRGTWATPLVIRAGDRDELIVAAPRRVTAHDPATGKRLWTCRGLGPLVYSSPMWGDDVLVALGGYHSASLAVRPGGSGDVTGTRRLWRTPRSKLRLGTGLIHEAHLYVNDTRGLAQCLDVKTGRLVWEKRHAGPGNSGASWSSYVRSGDVIYALNQAGDTFVFKASPRYERLAVNSLGETTNSTPAISDGQIFIRTHKAVWCIAEK